MPCESCSVQFTIFKHKKSCSECRRLFCLNCLEKTRKRSLCSRCVVFNKRPLSRVELQRLKARDLIVYLQSKHIPTAGCVEKDDLVNLVLAHVDSMTSGASPSSNSSSSIPSPGSHYDNLRSYFNNLTSQQQQQSQHSQQANNNNNSHSSHSSRTNAPNQRPPAPPPPPQRQSSRESGGFTSSGENAFSFLRQGCQVILDNVTDKLTTNFKFEPTQASSSSRNSSSPSSATSPSTSTHPPNSSQRLRQQQNSASQRSAEWENVQAPAAAASSRNNEMGNTSHRPPPQQPTRPKPRVPLDTIRMSESGCECSDDEESKQQRTLSQSTSNLLDEHPLMAVPGTSGVRNGGVPVSRSKGSTLSDSSEFSSFEELNVVTVERKATKSKPTAMTTIDVQIEVEGRPQQPEPVSPGATAATSDATTSSRAFPASGRVITRRRSDGCLNGRLEGGGGGGEVQPSREEQQHRCCSRCGRKKNELKRRLKRFHDQLTALSTQDVEVRKHLEAILLYLERKRASVLSNGEEEEESLSEPAVIVSQPLPRGGVDGVDMVQREEPPVPAVPPPLPQQPQVEGEEEGQKTEKVVYKRRFVQLDEIKSSSDLEEFSVKQLKEILVLNRVDFKGCCEKKELIERVRRLLDDYHACPSIDKLPSDDLCKICMDAPIECVILECGHMATCTSCGKVLSECPICRQFIIRVVRFFRA